MALFSSILPTPNQAIFKDRGLPSPSRAGAVTGSVHNGGRKDAHPIGNIAKPYHFYCWWQHSTDVCSSRNAELTLYLSFSMTIPIHSSACSQKTNSSLNPSPKPVGTFLSLAPCNGAGALYFCTLYYVLCTEMRRTDAEFMNPQRC